MVKRWGLTKTFYFYFVRFFEKFLFWDGSLCLVYSGPLAGDDEDKSEAPNPSRVLTSEEVIAFSSDNPELDMTPEMVRKALERGDQCVGTIIDGQLVSYGWRAYDVTPHTEKIWVRVGPKAFYSYKGFTLREFRGRHIGERGKYCGTEALRQRGITSKQSFIASTNYSSLASTKRGNLKHVGYAGHLHLFGKTICFRSPGAKRVGYEFFLHDEV